MTLGLLIRRSLAQHWMSTLAAVLSLALGIGLMTAVLSLRQETHRQFTRVGLGVDAVLGPKGSPLQIVLNAIYNLEEMPGKIAWPLVEELRKHDVVERVIPFCTGHSFGGFRVNAIERDFFSGFEIQPGKTLSFDATAGGQGRAFAAGNVNEAVIGWEAARRLGVKLGDSFNPVCGVNQNDPEHHQDQLVFVGVLARTGTPYDRVIYIPLERFYTLG
ncbi:MAG TPA: ABC transporter permease, partial [Candidatus Ozemobacteraceae bacterium]|nr:ABC transporter permease [Candidatus Ozemobacteraceae bacterium]